MKLFPASNYSLSTYPDVNVPDREKKKDEFGLRMVNYMYSQLYVNMAQWRGWNNEWNLNRLYMDGRQPTSQYKEQYRTGRGQQAGDESYVNLDYSIMPILPKYMELVRQKVTSRRTKIVCNAVNPMATSARDEKLFYLTGQITEREFLQSLEMEYGVELLNQDPNLPKNTDELELFKMTGGLKLAAELAAELGIELVMGDDKWAEIYPGLIDDAFCTGRANTWKYEDPGGKLRVDRVLPEDVLYDFSMKKDYSDARFGARFLRKTRPEFREMATGYLTKEEIDEICLVCPGYVDNIYMLNDRLMQNRMSTTTNDQWIGVVEFWFLSTNKMTFEESEGKYGDTLIKEVEEDYQPPAESKYKKKKIQKEYQVVYKGYWVIGTDTVFNYGLMPNMGREKGYYKTRPPQTTYIFNNFDGNPLPKASGLRPAADLFQKGWLKVQNLNANEPPPGLSIDVSGFLNVDLGKGPVKATDLAELYKQTGNYYYNGLDPVTGMRTNARPIEPNVIDFSPAKMAAWDDLFKAIELIRQILGFNETTDAGNVSPKMLVGVSEAAMMATNAVLTPFAEALGQLKMNTAKSVLCSLKSIVRTRGYSDYLKESWGVGMRYYEVATDVIDFDYDVELEEMLADEQRAVISKWIDLQLSVRQQMGGVGGISFTDALIVQQCKTYKQAVMVLELRMKKRAEEDAQKKQAEIEAQAQANAQAQQGAAQQAAQVEQMKAQAVMAMEEEKRKTLMLQSELTKQEIMLQIELEKEKAIAVERIRGNYSLEKAEIVKKGTPKVAI